MKWYEYIQNNSGGSFHIDPNAGIGRVVLIEAHSPDHADARAERIGIYFDGVENDMDCKCCGDRWYSAEYGEEYENLESLYAYRERSILPNYAHPIDGDFYVFTGDGNE